MNVTDMILVMERNKEGVTNSIMNLMDFVEFTEKKSWLSLKELAEDMAALGRTCGEKEVWMESCFAADTAVFARYCADEKQLESFVRGEYSTDREWVFDERRCSKECLDYMKVLGISTDDRLRWEHGLSGKIKTKDDYHSYLKSRFNLFHTLSQSMLATDSIKSEAVKAMYEEFGTGRQEVFLKNLEGGKYDSDFAHETTQRKAR